MKGDLVVDVLDDDYTIQLIEDIPEAGQTVCLWKGDGLASFLMVNTEFYLGSLTSYRRAFEHSLKFVGAKDLVVEELIEFDGPAKPETQCISAEYILDGEKAKQIVYLTRLKGRVQLAIFTITDGSISDVASRTHAIMKSIRLGDKS